MTSPPRSPGPAGRALGAQAARAYRTSRALAGAALETLRQRRGVASPPGPDGLARGVVLLGTLWTGADAEPVPGGAVVVDGAGVIRYLGPAATATLPADLPVLGGAECWIGPGIVDAHVHLAFTGPVSAAGTEPVGGGPDGLLAAGLVAVRDLGAPGALARSWRSGHRAPERRRPFVAAAGPIITAPDGYPSRSWGRGGFAEFVASAGAARQTVQRLAADGADLIKIALEPGPAGAGSWPVPDPATVRAVVDAAHAAGLAVCAHALRVEMVGRALDAGVDELAHTPTEPLPEALLARLADTGVAVVSTLQTFFAVGDGRVLADNATALHDAGVRLRYGTDLGNAGTRPGVDPRELDRLADAGLGRLGALRAATEYAAQAPGIRRRTGRLALGAPAELVLLPGDPLREPGVWRAPLAVVADARLVRPGASLAPDTGPAD